METMGAGIKVKPDIVAVPPGVVTVTSPVAHVDPTFTVMVVELTTVKLVPATPPNLTAVAPVNPVPVMVTVIPAPALVGVKDVMVGTGNQLNPDRVAVPPMVETETKPDVPAPTTAVMEVEDTTVNDVAGVPPKLTAEAVEKLVPVMVTVVPAPALVGVKEVMVGAGIKVKPARDAVPPGVVTDTLPDDPVPTVAVMVVGESTVNEVAFVVPNLTTVAPVKLVPVIVTIF